jgi:hypothetical protein
VVEAVISFSCILDIKSRRVRLDDSFVSFLLAGTVSGVETLMIGAGSLGVTFSNGITIGFTVEISTFFKNKLKRKNQQI